MTPLDRLFIHSNVSCLISKFICDAAAVTWGLVDGTGLVVTNKRRWLTGYAYGGFVTRPRLSGRIPM